VSSSKDILSDVRNRERAAALESRGNDASLGSTAPIIAFQHRAFAALARGGKIEMPLAKTFWSPKFGMLTDRFGVGWMVSVAAKNPLK
jgi:PhnB protein